MSAYIRQLRELSADTQSDPQHEQSTLRSRLIKWFTTLPAPTRNRPFSMHEFEVALGAPGRLISPILIELGWQRKRQWTGREHYHRYWVLPTLNR